MFLAYKAFQSWRQFDPAGPVPRNSGQNTLVKAVIVNLLNPNPYLGWSLIMGPLFLEGWAENPVNAAALVSGFYLTMVAMLAFTIILFGFTRKLGPKISKGLIGLSALALFLFGLYQLWIGIQFTVKV